MLPRYVRLAALAVIAVVAHGCAGDPATGPTPDPTECVNGATTDLGADVPTAASGVIGSAGGTVVSADGRVTLTVSPGVLSRDYTIGLQPVVNTAPIGIGRGIRIVTDANVAASLPVTLKFKYDAADIEGTVASALGIAFFTPTDAIWKTSGSTVNTQDSTVTISLPMLTGMRLAMFAVFSLGSDDSPVVDPGGTYTAAMWVQPKIAEIDTLKPGSVILLCAPVQSTEPVVARLEVGASGGGGGAAAPGSGNASGGAGSATYTAPPTVPGSPWLALLVRWPAGYRWGTVEVYNFVWVGGVIEFTLDGKFYSLPVMPPIAYTGLAAGRTRVSGATNPGEQPVVTIGFSFKLIGVGTHMMDNTGNMETDDSFSVTVGEKSFYTYYYDCVGGQSELKWTDLGSVTVSVANRERRYISGRFSGRIAALDGTKVLCGSFEVDNWKVYPISGTFRCGWGVM